jgi:hypothetical protein
VTLSEIPRCDSVCRRKDIEEVTYQLSYATGELVRAIKARRELDTGFKGMGHNILVEAAGRLPYALRLAEKALERVR